MCEEAQTMRRSESTWRSGRTQLWMLIGIVAIGIVPMITAAQLSSVNTASSAIASTTPTTAPANTDEVSAVIRSAQVNAPPQSLSLAVNKSILLEFSVPVKRAAVAGEEIATLSVVSPKQVMLTGKAFGFTQVMIWCEDNRQVVYDVRVDVNLERLQQTLRDAAPRARITLSSILDTVVISGVVPDAPTAERIVALAKVFAEKVNNQLQVAGVQQVLLRATIAEVSREATRELGLNGTFFGAKAFGGSNLGGINPTSIGLQSKTLIPLDLPNQFQAGPTSDLAVNPSTTLYFGLPRAQMELFLKALQEDNLIRVLAEPNLVAISGHEAEFLAGGELPVPTPTSDGIAITFREYGVRLKFRPVVQDGQMIRVAMTSEVSEPDFTNAVQISGLTIPGLTKRTTQTMVEIGSGQTFAIAGLLSESVRGIAQKVPGAGAIPVLGALFRSMSYQRSQTELVVLVTPELALPMNPDQVNFVAGANTQQPSDWQLFGLGMLSDDTATRPLKDVSQAPHLPEGAEGPLGEAPTDAPAGTSMNLDSGASSPTTVADTPAVSVAVPSSASHVPNTGAEPQPAFAHASAVDFPEPLPSPLPAN